MPEMLLAEVARTWACSRRLAGKQISRKLHVELSCMQTPMLDYAVLRRDRSHHSQCWKLVNESSAEAKGKVSTQRLVRGMVLENCWDKMAEIGGYSTMDACCEPQTVSFVQSHLEKRSTLCAEVGRRRNW